MDECSRLTHLFTLSMLVACKLTQCTLSFVVVFAPVYGLGTGLETLGLIPEWLNFDLNNPSHSQIRISPIVLRTSVLLEEEK